MIPPPPRPTLSPNEPPSRSPFSGARGDRSGRPAPDRRTPGPLRRGGGEPPLRTSGGAVPLADVGLLLRDELLQVPPGTDPRQPGVLAALGGRQPVRACRTEHLPHQFQRLRRDPLGGGGHGPAPAARSEERRVGKECR